MGAHDEAVQLLTRSVEFLTAKVEKNEARIHDLEISRALSDGRAKAFSPIYGFLAGIGGAIATSFLMKYFHLLP